MEGTGERPWGTWRTRGGRGRRRGGGAHGRPGKPRAPLPPPGFQQRQLLQTHTHPKITISPNFKYVPSASKLFPTQPRLLGTHETVTSEARFPETPMPLLPGFRRWPCSATLFSRSLKAHSDEVHSPNLSFRSCHRTSFETHPQPTPPPAPTGKPTSKGQRHTPGSWHVPPQS